VSVYMYVTHVCACLHVCGGVCSCVCVCVSGHVCCTRLLLQMYVDVFRIATHCYTCFIWQKRPIHMAKETYAYGKRDLFICMLTCFAFLRIATHVSSSSIFFLAHLQVLPVYMSTHISSSSSFFLIHFLPYVCVYSPIISDSMHCFPTV